MLHLSNALADCYDFGMYGQRSPYLYYSSKQHHFIGANTHITPDYVTKYSSDRWGLKCLMILSFTCEIEYSKKQTSKNKTKQNNKVKKAL